MERWVGILGILIIFAIAFAFSKHKRRIEKRVVLGGLLLQIALALLVLGIPALNIPGPLQFAFSWANDAIMAILRYTEDGSRFIFGDLIRPDKFGFLFAFQVLPTIIFTSSLMSVLYHWGIMQRVVHGIAKVMQKTMNLSGAECMSVAADIFVGQTESPLVIKPFIKNMTTSELLALMTGGMATVAGGVMAAYVGLLKDRIPDIAGHLLTASVMSAPAALIIAKILWPETEKPETLGRIPKEADEKIYTNTIEAAATGAGDGLSLALNVGAMLLAFIALIAMLNGALSFVGHSIHFHDWGANLVPSTMKAADGSVHLTFQLILAWMFAPFAWFMGVPWSEAVTAGSFLGEKLVLNEFVAYLHLSELSSQLSDRTVIILSYALCGFANFSSIAIQIGGTGGIAPTRKRDLARLGLRALLGGTLATMMTATIAGLLL